MRGIDKATWIGGGMTDIPIIFSASMVRALLEGRKSQTRRLAWKDNVDIGVDLASETQEDFELRGWSVEKRSDGLFNVCRPTPWQKVNPGDRLYVRETIQRFDRQPRATAQYAATISAVPHRGVVEGWYDGRAYWQWKKPVLPSIHMPRWASRLTLIVTATKIERLQAISEVDAMLEGIGEPYLGDGDPPFTESAEMISRKKRFRNLWNQLHGEGAWDANPEVVALTFTVHKQNIDRKPPHD